MREALGSLIQLRTSCLKVGDFDELVIIEVNAIIGLRHEDFGLAQTNSKSVVSAICKELEFHRGIYVDSVPDLYRFSI